MRIFSGLILSLVISATVLTTALAQSRVVYRYKAWELRVVALDDGSLFCVAQVRPSNGTTFAIWADGRNVKLQYYANVWDFGNSSYAQDVVARIDGRPQWNLRNAEFYKNSVIFTMPDGSGSTRFLREVAAGNTMRLYRDGRRMGRWSLAGSRATMTRLVDCVKLL